MIITNKRTRGPIVRHSEDKELKNGASRILKAFTKEVELHREGLIEKKYIKKEYLFKEDIEGKTLLELRKKLIFTLRKGMLERQDLEVEIGVLAAFVWFGRQSKETQDKILEGL